MDILEAGLKELRGILENDLRELKMKVEQMQNSSSDTAFADSGSDCVAGPDGKAKRYVGDEAAGSEETGNCFRY